MRAHEERCPFCGVALAAVAIAAPVVARRSRAAQMAFVASVLVGCREEPKPTADVPEPPKVVADTKPAMNEPVVVDASNDASKPEEPDTAAAAPAPSPSVTAKVPVLHTAKPQHTALHKPYGAPPADGLIV